MIFFSEWYLWCVIHSFLLGAFIERLLFPESRMKTYEMVRCLPSEIARRLQFIYNIPWTQISAVTYFVLKTKHISFSLGQLVEINSIQYIIVVRLLLWVDVTLVFILLEGTFHQLFPLFIYFSFSFSFKVLFPRQGKRSSWID